ncbi:MAG: PolC-type DNA polymerase III [Oligoflexus sp.]
MSQLHHSMFYEVFFAKEENLDDQQQQNLCLKKVLRYLPPQKSPVRSGRLVIFDFETTGLDTRRDQIIEIGALLTENGKIVDEFSSLVNPGQSLTDTIVKITGITDEMLADKPCIEQVLPDFLKFMEGSILVAHNAEFDMAFLRAAAERLGYQLDWPCFCTLKLARQLLPDLESKNLDTLAKHFGLSFEARHRSIGDCKVTSAVLQSMLQADQSQLTIWDDFQPFAVA